MFRRGFFVFRLLASLLLIAVLIAAGVMIFRAGQAQGYALGAAAAAASPSNPPGQVVPAYPNMPYAWPGYYGMHFSPFGPLLGLFFFGGLIFFVFFVVGGLFRFRGGMHPGHHWKDYAEWAKQAHEQRQAGQPGGQPPAPPAAS